MQKQFITATSIIAACVLFVGIWSFTRAQNVGVLTACVNRTGIMRLLDTTNPNNKCRRDETNVSWNVQGQTGLQGPQGEQGEKGDKGEQGSSGRQLHIYDANGQDLGIWSGGNNNAEHIRTFDTDLELFFYFTNDNTGANYVPQIIGVGGTHKFFFFEELDCQGPIFSSSNYDLQALLTAHEFLTQLFPKYWKYNTQQQPKTRTARSAIFTRSSQGGGAEAFCHNLISVEVIDDSLLLQEVPIDNLPFTEPLKWPLVVK
ncbi:MAG: hypothetical protein G01um101448_462 [Parcubacteria group bacterium Gr01-1014_48]|nr:MAG: hypothetical protein Greene041614_284 [Parcubacteria group bacterium Greene0416_14]TSC73914.1 MAG: hypothetical protein G01um101448_462 [Parcubacteria group bacterium Gr01-1014_48]TSD00315.1 MAG: hypothetical protein Greene101415_906 [Parcubacteria group bacterium Greene1014_15]TSD07916.1 MAG: hypothetical protein Greene07144_591 [Parcubacteria group bacterium Greene0714_4]